VVSPDEYKSCEFDVIHIPDEKAIEIKINDIKYRRKNWIYQQLIKLGQDFTENDLYLCVDSDLFFNKELELFKNRKPIFFVTDKDQYHQPYFNFMKHSHGLDRQVNHTFICDFMMFDKSKCAELIGNKERNLEKVLDYCNNNITDNFMLSEFELYGNFVTKYYKDSYLKQNIRANVFGKSVRSPWTLEEVSSYVINMKKYEYDLFTMHTWT
jgi:hypothetical protein